MQKTVNVLSDCLDDDCMQTSAKRSYNGGDTTTPT
jgi:hypothetical protein